MSAASFQPNLLLSPAFLHQFISGQEESLEILLAARSPASSTTHGRTWNDRGTFCSDLKGFFLMVTSYVLQALSLTDLSRKAWVASRHAIHCATVAKTHRVFQNSLLSGSVNTHRADTEDFFLSRPMQTTLATPTPGTLHFFHKGGICRGMCHWFIHLYFKTQASFSDPEVCIRSVGQHFTLGASRQAAFLQSLDLSVVYDLLHLTVREDDSTLRTLATSEDQIIAEFQRRPPGVYGIYIASHQLVHVKIDESRQYLFDPNQGVIKVESASLFKKAMEEYFASHDSSHDIHIDLYTSR